MYFFRSIKITSLFFQPEVVHNHDYKLHFVYCRFLCNCSLLNADLSVNIKNSGKKRSDLTRLLQDSFEQPFLILVLPFQTTWLSSWKGRFLFLQQRFCLFSYEFWNCNSFNKICNWIFFLVEPSTSLPSVKNSRSWEKEILFLWPVFLK